MKKLYPNKRFQGQSHTERILQKMMVEQVPHSILDSGGVYGYNHERNAKQGFEKLKSATISVDEYGIEVWIQLYPWLRERLDFDPDMDGRFRRWAKQPENERESWHVLVEAWPEELRRRGWEVDVAGYLNSYNGDSSLSQEIQCFTFTAGYPRIPRYAYEYVLLQIHGGCDIRGGYTDPRVFTTNHDYSLFDTDRYTIWCTRPYNKEQLTMFGLEPQGPHYWDVEGGYFGCGNNNADMKSLVLTELQPDEDPKEAVRRVPQALFYDQDGTGYCPLCAWPLEASA